LPPIVEALGTAGLYFTPGNSNDLASALLQALNDPEKQRENGRACREIVENRFSWRVILPLLDDLYAEVVTK
jgi:glycosyltransferase involved in cell wall biosynthesis